MKENNHLILKSYFNSKLDNIDKFIFNEITPYKVMKFIQSLKYPAVDNLVLAGK